MLQIYPAKAQEEAMMIYELDEVEQAVFDQKKIGHVQKPQAVTAHEPVAMIGYDARAREREIAAD